MRKILYMEKKLDYSKISRFNVALIVLFSSAVLGSLLFVLISDAPKKITTVAAADEGDYSLTIKLLFPKWKDSAVQDFTRTEKMAVAVGDTLHFGVILDPASDAAVSWQYLRLPEDTAGQKHILYMCSGVVQSISRIDQPRML